MKRLHGAMVIVIAVEYRHEQATSPENQRAMILRECQVQGWRLDRFFEDRASGTSVRPGGGRCLGLQCI
ncbi:recombinase family protein [bacterium]|nr:recombinase family protein [bacterium]